jgi:hypothetical protein
MAKKKLTKEERIQHERDYIAFLKKRLASEHFQKTASDKELDEVDEKLSKAKLVLRCLEAVKK